MLNSFDYEQPIVHGQPTIQKNNTKINPAQIRYSGIVKFYDNTKGFGVLKCIALNKELSFSRQSLLTNRLPRPNDKAAFSINNDYAINVRI